MNDEIEAILIGEVNDIDLDCVEHFEYDDLEYAIFHLSSGFYGTQGLCPCNQHGVLSDGNVENDEVECPSCGNTFSIVSGDSISNPEIDRLKIFDVTVESDKLYINL